MEPESELGEPPFPDPDELPSPDSVPPPPYPAGDAGGHDEPQQGGEEMYRNMDKDLVGAAIAKLRYIFSPNHSSLNGKKTRSPEISAFKALEVAEACDILKEEAYPRQLKALDGLQWRDITNEDRRRIAHLVGEHIGIDPKYFEDGFLSTEGRFPIKRDVSK